MKRPHRFVIEVDRAFPGTTLYLIKNGILRRESRSQASVEITPKVVDWHGFWRFCEFIQIWQWKTEYNPADVGLIFRDGITWTLDLAYDKSKRIRVNGNNVYPSFNNPRTSVVTMDRFGLLLDFVDGMLRPAGNGLKPFYANEDLQ